ncbi:MAG: DUF4381 domain-containing protein [Woeseiaceae bacterium]
MNPESLPIRDIHLPAPVGWWPLAPGWWFLLLLIGVGIGFAIWYYRRPQARRRRAAIRLLASLQQTYAQEKNSQQLLQSLSALLRRYAIAVSGRTTVAGLVGESWRHYLNEPLPEAPFSEAPADLLISAPYAKTAPALNEQEAERLLRVCREWIEVLRQ